MKKVLILGGTKFVGRQLVEDLLVDKSNEIYLFNRGETNPDIFPGVKKIIGDRETEDINQIKNHAWDFVVDFSSFYPKSLKKTILNINRDVKNYIYISSISAYSFANYDSSFSIKEDYELKTCSKEEALDTELKTYGKRKVACERILESFDWLNTTILRPSIIYGKYDWTDRFYYWLYKVKKGQVKILPDSGNHKLTLTYATDLVRVIEEFLKEKIPKGIYNVSTHEPFELKEIIKLMAKALGTSTQNNDKGIPQEWLLENKVKPQNDIPLWLGGSLMLSNEKLSNNSVFKFTPFEESIKNTVKYFNNLNWDKPTVGLTAKKEQKILKNYEARQDDNSIARFCS